jgi:hypothetical protein
MHIPKIVFREMTLKENIDLIKWAYFEKDETLDIRSFVIEYFKVLADIDKDIPRDEIYKIIEEVVTVEYNKYKSRIKKEVSRYNQIWINYNDKYFKTLSNYLNIEWPIHIHTIDASVGLTPIFPRYLDKFSFSTAPDLEEWQITRITAHETLHFLWFEKWKELYPEIPPREYDSPYITWQYSEMVPDPILNSKEINNIFNFIEKVYDSFYEIKDGETLMMDNLIKIYNQNKSIEDKIREGFDYIKNILDK